MSAMCSRIWATPQRFFVARATMSSKPSAAQVRPSARRRWWRATSFIGVLLEARGEVVVVVEPVGLDDLVADPGVVGQGEDDGRLAAVRATALVEDVRDGFGAE